MQITSIVAIYALFWVLCAFFLLPFGIKPHSETQAEKVPGQADSAPINFRPGRLALRATLMAAAFTAFFVANYAYEWITVDDINITNYMTPPN